jgi:uncharacterized protein
MRWLKEWRLTPYCLAIHEPTATAVVADLHLGYSAARQRQGDAIPARNVDEELKPLFKAAAAHDVRFLLVAGDLFEAGYDAGVAERFLAALHSARIQFLGLIPGNHDCGMERANSNLPIFVDGYQLAGWRVIHGDQPANADRLMMGHWHPALRWHGRKTPCFLTRGAQLVLPAFSRDAAGADVWNEVRWRDWDCHAIVEGVVIKPIRLAAARRGARLAPVPRSPSRLG